MEIKGKISDIPLAPIDINELQDKIEKIIDQQTYVHYRHQEYIVNGSDDAAAEIVKLLQSIDTGDNAIESDRAKNKPSDALEFAVYLNEKVCSAGPGKYAFHDDRTRYPKRNFTLYEIYQEFCKNPTAIVINEEFIEWLNLEYTMDKETKKYYPNYMYGYDEQQITVQEAYAEFLKKVKK